MAALQDPVRQLQAFAFLVQKAALTALMEDSKDAFTLFAPDDKVRMTRTLNSASAAPLCCRGSYAVDTVLRSQWVVCSQYSAYAVNAVAVMAGYGALNELKNWQLP
jgi:hypothetical protein